MMLSRKNAGSREATEGPLSVPVTFVRFGLMFIMTLALSGAPQLSRAWSEGGHIAIAELAVRELTDSERETLDKISVTLTKQNRRNAYLAKRYDVQSATALTAAWLDDVRGRSVTDIFNQYGEEIPRELKSYADRTTDDWHYSNVGYFDEKDEAARFAKQCPRLNDGELNNILPLLKQAFVRAEDPRDKAIVLAMLVHLVGDAHQPLHTITRATKDCQHDRGGNGFCVAPQKGKGRCKENLHRAWDSGFGLFYQKDFKAVISVITDQRLIQQKIYSGLQPGTWQMENLALADEVYSAVEGEYPDRDYLEKGTKIIRQRAYLAAQRLAGILRELAQSKPLHDSSAPSELSAITTEAAAAASV